MLVAVFVDKILFIATRLWKFLSFGEYFAVSHFLKNCKYVKTGKILILYIDNLFQIIVKEYILLYNSRKLPRNF